VLDEIDDIRIREIRSLTAPAEIIREIPRTEASTRTVARARDALRQVIHRYDDRLAVIVGPCSIHDPDAAIDYAERLLALRKRLHSTLEVVMRGYFEKPRTTVGWKGLINDPNLDGSFDIERGLRLARLLLQAINGTGLPVGCEFLDTTTPQYIADLVSWVAIGARTTESQVHREMASGLSCPVGFKNGTNGDVKIAVDAVTAAARPHHFMAVTKDGRSAIAETAGNDDCHIVLRGGDRPNYDTAGVDEACDLARRSGVTPSVMIDVSHANSGKDPSKQPAVIEDVARQIEDGDHRIVGVMIESNLVGGSQKFVAGQSLVYGQSITDGCIDWDTTVAVLERLAAAVEQRRFA